MKLNTRGTTRLFASSFFALACLLFLTGTSPMLGDMAIAENIAGCQIFPLNNVWNTPIDNLPVHSLSAQWVDTIGRNTGFHMDFGSGTWDGGPIGIPYNVVDNSIPKVSVDFYYPDESDPGPYPIPSNPLIEHGSDHHILIIDSSTCTLYEIYDASYSGGDWFGGSGAIWSLGSNALRPTGWTSADAAGLPILPGLVRYNEIVSGEINHAIRFTASQTNGYIWPARHLTSNNPSATHIPPMGARFRLKSSFNISGYPAEMQVILRAMKKYGIILADNGSNWYVSGAPDENWDNDMLHLLDDLTGNDFEAVDESWLMVDPNSGQAHTSLPFTFTDALPSHWAFDWIERLYDSGITGGCATGPLRYCPDNSVTRAQMAIFIERGMNGSAFSPPPANGTVFGDVPATHWAAAWIEQLANDGITSGCGTGSYCPDQPVTRAQMAIFLLKAKYGSGYLPPVVGASSGFADVPTSYWAAAWIKQLAAEGITSGCSAGNYCPDQAVSRAQMAVFLVRTFNLP
ncbi:MAG: hypothetical protein CVU44_12160 [Chloroflexi bacterium HGW-Chloroflexi-6]|nr:MAG: hypothetical protein CVU44_12160 [Chloroflexi bacterium HGW-Chloroflexi-6]